MFTDPIQNVVEFGFLPGQLIADLGSGAGHYTFAISKAVGENGRVYSVDYHEEALNRIASEAEQDGRKNIRVILGDIEKPEGTSLKDSCVDGVVFSNILFQLNKKESALIEAFRILKPGGSLGIVEWSDLSFLTNVKTETKIKLVSEKESRQICEKAGFVFVKTFEAGDHHYGLIYKKPNN